MGVSTTEAELGRPVATATGGVADPWHLAGLSRASSRVQSPGSTKFFGPGTEDASLEGLSGWMTDIKEDLKGSVFNICCGIE